MDSALWVVKIESLIPLILLLFWGRTALATKEDWVVAGAILGTIFLVGVLAWAFKKRGSPRREFKLRRIGQGKTVFQNLEEHEIFEPEPGRIIVRVRRKVVRQ